jgi:hypothetical protein
MTTFPKNPEELLEIIKTPLSLLERMGVDVNVQGTITDIANHIPAETGGASPWLQNLWNTARGYVERGDILGGLWELIALFLNVAVGLLTTLVNLLRSFIDSF